MVNVGVSNSKKTFDKSKLKNMEMFLVTELEFILLHLNELSRYFDNDSDPKEIIDTFLIQINMIKVFIFFPTVLFLTIIRCQYHLV